MKTLLLFISFYVAVILAQGGTNTPDLITLPVVVHDYFPCGKGQWVTNPPTPIDAKQGKMIMDNCNPDIEPYAYSTNHWGSGLNNANPNMVSNTLGANRKPVYTLGSAPGGLTTARYQTKDATSYNKWWDSNWDGNYPINYVLNLKLDRGSGLYGIQTTAFYPIDNKGWGNNGDGSPHNWGFCVEAHAAFVYNSSATLTFEGDDDLWIFMNNELVFDIGGIHTPVGKTITLGKWTWTQKMEEFVSYPFDMFYCERQTAGSDLILTTTVNIYCPNNQYDACGVCQGKGDCCKPCVADKCTQATLNPRDCSCSYDPKILYDQCALQSDGCQTSACQPANGCVSTPKPPPNINVCQTKNCDIKAGWVVKNVNPCYTNDTKCFPTKCDGTQTTLDQACIKSTSNQCQGACSKLTASQQCKPDPCSTVQCFDRSPDTANTYDCIQTSYVPANTKCVNYRCADDKVTVLSSDAITCTNSSNLCYNSTCDVTLNNNNGGCTAPLYKNCNDNNNCTRDYCVEATGACQNDVVPLPSVDNTCILASCDPVYGTTVTPLECKGIDCTQDPKQPGCCICKGIPLGAIIGAGAIAGIAIGGAAAAGALAFAGKKGFDYYGTHRHAAQATLSNPMYVQKGVESNNPMYAN